MIIIPSLPSLPPLSFLPLCRRGASGGGDDGGGGCGGGWRRRWRRRAATAAAAKMRRVACAWEGLKPHPPGPSIGADGRRSPGVARATVSFRSGGTRQASLFLLLLLAPGPAARAHLLPHEAHTIRNQVLRLLSESTKNSPAGPRWSDGPVWSPGRVSEPSGRPGRAAPDSNRVP